MLDSSFMVLVHLISILLGSKRCGVKYRTLVRERKRQSIDRGIEIWIERLNEIERDL